MSQSDHQNLSLLDRTFLAVERTDTPHNIGVLLLFGRAPDGIGSLASTLEDRLQASDSLRRRLQRNWFSIQQWRKDDRIDVRHHVFRHCVHGSTGETGLLRLVADLHAQPLDQSRPLWECHVAELSATGETAVYFKAHHALTDGIGLRSLLATVMQAEFRSAPAQSSTVHHSPGSKAATTRVLRIPVAPRGPLNVRVGSGRQVAIHTVPMGPIREIVRWAGCTINDVALTMVGEAVHNVLVSQDQCPPPAPYRVLVPVATDRPDELLGNRVGAVLVNVPVGHMAAASRLCSIAQSTGRAKGWAMSMPGALLSVTTALPLMALHAVALRIGYFDQRLVNLSVSNVPGPIGRVTCGGAQLTAIYPMASIALNMAIAVCVTSYEERLAFGVVADAQLGVQVDAFMEGLVVGIQRLTSELPASTKRLIQTGRVGGREH